MMSTLDFETGTRVEHVAHVMGLNFVWSGMIYTGPHPLYLFFGSTSTTGN